MMGSRGEAPAQATAIAGLFEIAELLRNAEKTMPAAIAEMRTAAVEAKTAKDELDKTVAEHGERTAALASRDSALQQMSVALVAREAACQEREAEIARKYQALDVQTTLLADRKRELDRQEGIVKGDQEELKAIRMLHTADHEAKTAAMMAEIDQQRRNSEAATMVMRAAIEAEIHDMRAKAQQEITAAQESLQAREDKLTASAEALHSERARLTEMLKE